MAPLHHHFELSGWKENKVVSIFAVTNINSKYNSTICYINLKYIKGVIVDGTKFKNGKCSKDINSAKIE